MYRYYKKKIVWTLLIFVGVFSVLWKIFLVYAYFTNGEITMPESWINNKHCNLATESNKGSFIDFWNVRLQNLSQNVKHTLYNIQHKSCPNSFFPNFKSNIQKVMNYKILKHVPCYDSVIEFSYNEEFPVIVTAASSNHYLEAQALLRSIHRKLVPLYKNVKVILYDIGLTNEENTAMKKYCKCEVIKFPFHRFPRHVHILENYAWKPLIIFEILRQYQFVMWVDVCIRFKFGIQTYLIDIFNKTRMIGIQLQESPRWIVSNQTKPDTFTALNEPECLYDYPELESGWIFFWKNSFIENVVLRPWVGCALTENCMSHPYPSYLRSCASDIWKFLLWTRCHRFDQSVLNIILIRVFNRHRKLVEFKGTDIVDILRGDKARYFPH